MKQALARVCSRLVRNSSQLVTKRAFAAACSLGGLTIVLSACGGGGGTQAVTSGSGFTSDARGESVTGPGGIENGAAAKIVPVPGSAPAVVALFPDGRANYSPDGFNLGGGGATVAAYGGSLKIIDVVSVSGGIESLLADGTAYFSPDGQNLGGGGATVSAYKGSLKVASLAPVGTGVDAVFLKPGGAYYSPDGLNLGGGGSSVPIYQGSGQITQIVAVGPGDAVVTLFADGSVYFSPDDRNIGGGGNSVGAAPGAHSIVRQLVRVGGGVIAEFENGDAYLSPDGNDLAGGGKSLHLPAWDASIADGPFQARDSAQGAQFLGRFWLSGGFALATNDNSCFYTCSFFDLWSSVDSRGTVWNSSPTFATATSPNPRDVDAVSNNGVPDVPAPTDFYDSYSAIVVWNGQLTAIGKTVWRSADGATWTRDTLADGVTAAPGPLPIRATENSRALVLGNTLFLVQPDSGEVYSTTDPSASAWTDLGAVPGFAPRCGAAVFTLLGRMWMVGGGACDYSKMYNQIWSSADGVNWSQNASAAQWSARMWPCVADSGDGIIWLAGGYAPTDWNSGATPVIRYGANHADVWYTRDGVDWRQLKADIGSGLSDDGSLEPRHAPTCFVGEAGAAGRNLVMIGGTGGSDPDDNHARVLNSIRSLPIPAGQSLP